MLRPDPMLSYNLARLHQNDLLAEAERDRVVRATRRTHRAAAVPKPTVTSRGSVSLWNRLALVFGRTSSAPNLAESQHLVASGQ
jgi:hypothetical protein